MEHNVSTVDDGTSDDTPIWRYIDVPKFVSILDRRALWFTKAALLLDDPYEGFCKTKRYEAPSPDDWPKVVLHSGPRGEGPVSLRQMRSNLSHLAADYCESARDRLYVNSWCLAGESMAMWQIYGSAGGGVALRSSVGSYRRAVRIAVREEQFAFGRVKYHGDIASSSDIHLDFSQGSIPMPGPGLWERILELGFHKRACFEYEKEWRCALYQDDQGSEVPGCSIDFDLDELVDEVFVGPRSEPFFLEAVSSLMQKFGLARPLKRSELLIGPDRGLAVDAK